MTAESDEPARVQLGVWPTAIEPMPRLARALGLGDDDLWIKRDDLIGLGGGGNKVRKLEWTCGAALADGADVLVTTGAPQSNHARLTAAAGARLGLDVVLVLSGGPDSSASGNLALDGLFGATIVWAGDAGLRTVAEQTTVQLRQAGRTPALLPFGGSSALSARGYRICADEILADLADVRTVVVALGSGGTMAGLVDGLGPQRVLGISVGAVEDPATTVAGLSGTTLDPRDLRIRLDQIGAGYATPGEPVMAAMRLAARTEGIVLDPIYTGRAMAGLIAAVAEGDLRSGHRTVFVHTGGLPGLFGHAATVAAFSPAP